MKSQQGIIPLVVLVAVGVIGTSGITVAASQKSIPGDALYGVKQATENVRVAAAISKKDKVKVHLDIAEEKVKEIEKLEEKGATDKIAEAAQGLEDSQDKALELTETIKSEGENVDELLELLEVQGGRQQVVLTRISPKIPIQAGESLRKSLEQFRKELEVVVESDEEDEQESEQEDSDQQETSQQTPCPSPSPSEDEGSDQEDEEEEVSDQDDEETDSENDWDDYWDSKYLYNEEENVNEDVEGVSQLRNSQDSSFGRDPCDSAEGSSGAGSRTFDGGAGSGDFEDSAPESSSDQGSSNEEPTSASPEVEGASTTGGLLQFILNVLFSPQKR